MADITDTSINEGRFEFVVIERSNGGNGDYPDSHLGLWLWLTIDIQLISRSVMINVIPTGYC